MAQQARQGLMITSRLPRYIPEDNLPDFEAIEEEIDKIIQVINDTMREIYRGLRSMYNVVTAGLNKDGTIKRQISHQQIKKNAIIPDVVDWGRKQALYTTSFGTDTATQVPFSVGGRLAWGNLVTGSCPGVSTTFLVWGGMYPAITDVNPQRITAGSWQDMATTLGAYESLYIYIRPREDNSPYTVQWLRSSLSSIQDAIKDGRILLCQARRTTIAGTPANVQGRLVMYGGGVSVGPLAN